MTDTSYWYVVQWADATGTGFSPIEPAGQAVPKEFWSVASRMLRDEVVQPPEVIRSTLPHPVWGLRYVVIGELGGFWCFTEQGRGGPFGVAGTCRFSFAPEDYWLPGDVWREGRKRATGNLPAGAPVARADLKLVLAELAHGEGPVGVPGTPAYVADVLAAILSVLPRTVVRSRMWYTCLLQLPQSHRGPVAAGRWPEEFRHSPTSLARQLDQLLDTTLPGGHNWLRSADDGERETLDWLLTLADKKKPLPSHIQSEAETVAGFLTELRLVVSGATVRDVSRLLRSEAGRRQLLDQPHVLGTWAATDPREALRFLRQNHDPGLTDAIFSSLREVQETSTQDVFDWPVTDVQLEEWHHRLANLLCVHLSHAAERTDYVFEMTRPGFPLADEKRLRAIRKWLCHGLKLSPWDEPELFPDRAYWIAEEINTTGGYGQHVDAEFDGAADPVGLLEDVVRRIARPLEADAVADLMRLVERRQGTYDPRWVFTVAKTLTQRAAQRDRAAAENWLAELVRRMADIRLSIDHQQAAMRGGIEVVRGRMAALGGGILGSYRPNEPALLHEFRRLGMDRANPESAYPPAEPPGGYFVEPSGQRYYIPGAAHRDRPDVPGEARRPAPRPRRDEGAERAPSRPRRVVDRWVSAVSTERRTVVLATALVVGGVGFSAVFGTIFWPILSDNQQPAAQYPGGTPGGGRLTEEPDDKTGPTIVPGESPTAGDQTATGPLSKETISFSVPYRGTGGEAERSDAVRFIQEQIEGLGGNGEVDKIELAGCKWDQRSGEQLANELKDAIMKDISLKKVQTVEAHGDTEGTCKPGRTHIHITFA